MIELAEIVLENTFNSNKKTYRQKRGTAIDRNLPYPTSFSLCLILKKGSHTIFHLKPYVWWHYLDDVFSHFSMGEKQWMNLLKVSTNPTLTLTLQQNIQKRSTHFLNNNFSVKEHCFLEKSQTRHHIASAWHSVNPLPLHRRGGLKHFL